MDVDVDLRLLRSFVTMAEEGNVGRAARRLYISQPALSKQLQRLEAFLGVELFHRHHRVLRLTPAGVAFLDDAEKLLAQSAEITTRARNTARADASQVTVAFVAGLVDLASALLQSAQQQPDLDVRLLRVDWTGQTDCLRTGRADLSLVRLPIDERDLEHQVLISEPRVAGLAITHPLAARTALSICELEAEPIIRTSNQQDYWTVSPRPSGTTPILGPLTDTVEEMLAVVASGRCMCITAQSLARAYPRPGIAWVPIPDISPSSVALAWPAQTPPAQRHAIADHARRAAVTVTLRDPAPPARSGRHDIDDPQHAQAPGARVRQHQRRLPDADPCAHAIPSTIAGP
jgi:DNA-binding transcriptional LysR family regulator